jgi:hypothetical protein
MDLFPVKILSRPALSFLGWVVVSVAVNVAIMGLFAYVIAACIAAGWAR